MDIRKLLCAFVLLAAAAHAQFNGYVGIQTTTPQVVFNNQGSTATVSITTNLGQNAHFLSFCIQGSFQGSINLQGSNNGGSNYVTIAVANYNNALIAQCHTLQGGGYWGLMRSTATVTGGTISAWYVGIDAPIAVIPTGLASIGPMPPIVCDRSVDVGVSTGTSNTPLLSPDNFGDVLYVCGFTLSFSQATTGGAVQFAWNTQANCLGTSGGQIWSMSTPSTAPQTIAIPISLNSPSLGGQNAFLCMSANTSGSNVTVNMSYASVHLL